MMAVKAKASQFYSAYVGEFNFAFGYLVYLLELHALIFSSSRASASSGISGSGA